MNPKLICTDIDGTLLDTNRELSHRTIQAIKYLKEEIPVVLISSRMPKAMTHLQSQMGIENHPLIAFNGGLIIDPLNLINPVLQSIEIEMDIAEDILHQVRNCDVHIGLYHGDEWYVPSMDQWALREQNNTKVSPEVADLQQICKSWKLKNKGAHKIMCMGKKQDIKILADYLTEHYDDQLHIYKSKPTYLEIASKKISKLSALSQLMNEKYAFGLEEVIAFGDNYNDIEMIQGVGTGVAVGNARDEVIAVSNRTTLHHKEDGVAIVLEDVYGLQYII